MRGGALALAFALGACARGRPPEPPRWERASVGGECEIAAMVTAPSGAQTTAALDGARDGAVGLIELFARSPIPKGRRVEACATLVPGKGEIAEWIIVAWGVPEDVARRVAASGKKTSGGASVVEGAGRRVLVWGDTWAVASTGAADRIAALTREDVAPPGDRSDGVFASISVRGEAARRIASEHGGRGDAWGFYSRELAFGYAELRARDGGLELVAHGTYRSERRAHEVAEGTRGLWDAASAGRFGEYVARVRAVAKLDVIEDHADVTATVRVPPSRDIAPPPPAVEVRPASPSDYGAACPSGQRLDLDRRACVEEQP